MKTLLIAVVASCLTSASYTAGGLVQGAGKDIQAVGRWIEPSGR